MNKLISPKLVIIEHYDSLIREIDIYTENLLRKSSNDNELLREEDKSSNNDKEKQINKNVNRVETYGIESRVDPYIDEYSYNQESDSGSQQATTLKEYLNSIRMRMIEELNRLQEESLQYYEEIKPRIQRHDVQDIEGLRSELFAIRFCFVLDIETVCTMLYDGRADKMKSNWSSLYLIVIDFYLNPSDIKLLKYFLYGWMDEQQDVHIHFDSKTLLVHLVYNYIRGYIRHHNRCKDKKIIHISKQLLCSINKVYLDCRDIESLHLDDEDHPNVDFTNIKSLTLITLGRGRRPKISLGGLANLEYLDLNEQTIEVDTFKNLTKLRHLYMMDCWMKSEEADMLFTNMPNLEYLRIIDPNVLGTTTTTKFSLNFSYLSELKWLRISHYTLNIDFFRSISQRLIALDLCFIRLDKEKMDEYFRDVKLDCLVKFELACCQIGCVKFEWFSSGFTSLRELNLFENEIKKLDLTNLHLPHLAELDLCNNDIEELNDIRFDRFVSLRVLKLSNNRLKKLSVDLFSNVKSLKELYLSRNELEELDSECFKDLTLDYLDLSSNPNISANFDMNVFLKLTNIKTIDLTFCFTTDRIDEIREFLEKNKFDRQVLMKKIY